MNKKDNPDWLDTSLYPFKGKNYKSKAGNIHYVEKGKVTL